MSSKNPIPDSTREITQFHLSDKIIGQIFDDKYEILSFLDKGGMGHIYCAHQRSLDRNVALKLMQAPEDPNAEKRFFLEASLCAQLQHPNTIKVIDFGQTSDGHVFIVMELLEGQPLSAKIQASGMLETKYALQYCRQICGALSEAHEKGIIHRDIKPSNIFLHQTQGEIFPKLIDFGLVKQLDKSSEISQTGLVMGSPMYMSPEQVDSKPVTFSSDIYSLGMTLYNMMTGIAPYDKGSLTDILVSQLRQDPKPLREVLPEMRFPDPIEWTIQTAIHKLPDQRFPSMTVFQAALEVCEEALSSGKDIQLILQNGTLSRSDGQVITRIRQKSASPHQKASKLNQGPTVKLNQSPTQSYITGSLASPPEKPKNNPWLIIYILCALGFVATLFVVFMYDAENPTPTPAINPTTASSSVEPTPPTAEERITVTLQSVPPLAEVYQNDMFVGNTPYEVRLKEGEEMIVVIQLDGYSSKELRLTTQSPSPTVHLSKSPIKPSAPQTRPQEVNTPQEQPSEPSTEIQTRDPWEE